MKHTFIKVMLMLYAISCFLAVVVFAVIAIKLRSVLYFVCLLALLISGFFFAEMCFFVDDVDKHLNNKD